MRIKSLVACAALVGCLASAGMAFDLGDKAPGLSITNWVKGEAADVTPGDNIYVVEFWATWCGPCRAEIPHITEMQKKFAGKGVVFVGVTKQDDRNTLDIVQDFVKDWGDKIGYRIAFDGEGNTFDAYMTAAGKNGIPHAFIVDKTGTLVWEGYPPHGMDEALAEVIAGTNDLDKERRIAEMITAFETAYYKDKNWKQALATIDELVAVRPSVEAAFQAEKFFCLANSGKTAEATAFGRKLLASAENPNILNWVAWDSLTLDDLKGKYTDLALAMAEKANNLTDGEDWAIVDTYARALFETGKIKEAIDWQKKAVKLAGPNGNQVEPALREYEEALKNAH